MNSYCLDDGGLRLLDLLDGSHSVLEWVSLLLKNRTFSLRNPVAEEARGYLVGRFAPDVSRYDLVRGYRADDSYFAYAQAFVENGIPVRLLERALKLGNLGEQVVLVSEQAFGRLEFQGAEAARASQCYPRFLARDIEARDSYRRDVRGARVKHDDVFVLDIMREGGGL